MLPTSLRRRRPSAWAACLALAITGLVPVATASSTPATATHAAPPASHGRPSAHGEVQAGDPVRIRRTYKIAAATTQGTIYTGATIKITGSVRTTLPGGKRKARPVALTEQVGSAWRPVAKKTSTKTGSYTFKVPAGDVATERTFQATAKAVSGLAGASTFITITVLARPSGPGDPDGPGAPEDGTYDEPEPLPDGYVGAGSAKNWSYLFDGGGRWNPCQVIRWSYNPTGEGYPALDDVQRAFAKISGASGLKFSYVGSTEWRYLGDINDPAFPAATADIAVGWASAKEVKALKGGVVGYGGASGAYVAGQNVAVGITRGYLILDNGDILPGGYTDGVVSWGQVMTHEILHSLGLGHTTEAVQLMYPMASTQNTGFGAGDLTGMTKIGSAAGCMK